MITLTSYVDGHWMAAPPGGAAVDVVNPATEDVVARVALGDAALVDAAVQAAQRAFATYGRTSLEERLVLVERLIAEFERRYDEMVTAITTEMGAPHDLSRQSQAACGPDHLKTVVAAARALQWDARSGSRGLVTLEPIGVCALITPWNWPINQLAAKVGPALVAGCTMVLKPSELAPLSAQLFAEFIHAAGFPPGVFNMIHGTGPGVGRPLAAHAGVDMVSFTGSTRAGIDVAKTAADTVKRVSQELGGKSANIVFADAGLEAAVKRGVLQCFNNSGQSCNAPTRMLVEKSGYERAAQIARDAGAKVQVGDPTQAGKHIGPVVSRAQFDKIQRLIGIGIAEGATVLLGGPGKPPGHERGFYVRPTIFRDVHNGMTIAREEVFGPVLCMIPFEGVEQAIEIANDTPYGLAAYVQCADLDKARAVARRLRAGSVYVNGAYQDYESPFGGYKQSGNGREWGVYGLHEFLETKVINGYYAP